MSGQWVVVLRDIPGNEDELLGPFHTEEKAEAIAGALRRDIAARDAEYIAEAFVTFVRPGVEMVDLRDELLEQLDEMGYAGRPDA